jgi:predicted phage terminase large subunit-like protein
VSRPSTEPLREQIDWYTVKLNAAFEIGGEDGYHEARAMLGREDLFYLLVYILNRKDMLHPWVYERAREVQAWPDGYLDLWAREHYKSTISTFGLNIQCILNNPEITIGIFSHTRDVAKAFLRQIMQEFETNDDLKFLYPDVLWRDPRSQAPRWSENNGIVVKRKGNPKEATIEAWGVVDSQPTSKHFDVLDYDDLVTLDTVSGREAATKIRTCTDAWATSLNLGRRGGAVRYKGSKYHAVDPYQEILRRGSAKERRYPATTNGKPDGEPVLMSREENAKKRRDMGPYVYGCQMLLDPKADSTMGFKREWLRFWKGSHYDSLTKIIIVDPASKKKKSSDFTAMWVLGLGADGNWYVIDLVYDKLSLRDRVGSVMTLHREYRPIFVGYEEYGLQADIEAVEWEQDRQTYHFDITPLGGKLHKDDRIRRLQPLFEQHRIYLLEQRIRPNWESQQVDVMKLFVEDEYEHFPVGAHDDALDALSRIEDEEVKSAAKAPKDEDLSKLDPMRGNRARPHGWLGA